MKLLVTPKSSNTGVFEKYFLSRESKIAICGEMISFLKKLRIKYFASEFERRMTYFLRWRREKYTRSMP
jgi:hypothetical protein